MCTEHLGEGADVGVGRGRYRVERLGLCEGGGPLRLRQVVDPGPSVVGAEHHQEGVAGLHRVVEGCDDARCAVLVGPTALREA
ncbi:MAG TPA: hypothetical protein VLG28_01855 [Acidimicrobiia bacterium]|nr:hypothetical protein [Acidimicrobiia bacterium]